VGYSWDVTQRFVDWVNRELQERGWSQSELGRRAGVDNSTISRVLDGSRSPTFDFCAAIARPLEERPEEVFRLAGLLPAHRGSEEERVIRELEDIARELGPEEQQRVTEYALWRLREQRARYRAGQSQAG